MSSVPNFGMHPNREFATINFNELNWAFHDPWLSGSQAVAVDDVTLSPPASADSIMSNLLPSSDVGNEVSIPFEDSLSALYHELEPFDYANAETTTAFDIDDDATSGFVGAEVGEPLYFAELQGEAQNAPTVAGGIIPTTAQEFELSSMEVMDTQATAPPPRISAGPAASVVDNSRKTIFKYQMDPDTIEDPEEKASVKQAIKAKKWRDNLKKKIEKPVCAKICKLKGEELKNFEYLVNEAKKIRTGTYGPKEERRMIKELVFRFFGKGGKTSAAKAKSRI